MIKIYYDEYLNDFCHKKGQTKTFSDLGELKNWIFGKMKQPYDTPYAMYFPDPRKKDQEPSSIDFQEYRGSMQVWIHQIQNENGIIFSDGTLTSGQKHWNDEIKNWLIECNEFKKKPTFNFV